MISVRSNWPVLRLVDAEIGRELHRAAHAFRHVDERAVGEHRRVERGEEVVGDRHHSAEILLHQIGVLLQRFRDRAEDHARLGQFRLEGGRHRYRVEHRVDGDARARAVFALDAEQRLALTQRDAELVVGLEDFRIDLVERLGAGLLLRRGEIIQVLIVDRGVGDPGPGRLPHGQPAAIGVEPPGQHPRRLVLLLRDEADDVFGKAFGRLVGFDVGDEPVLVLVNVDKADLIDGLLNGRHFTLHSRFQGPRVGLSVMVASLASFATLGRSRSCGDISSVS